MVDPFVVQQAYIIHYTLAFLPQIATDPNALHPQWRPVSAFAERRATWRPRNLVITNVGGMSTPPHAMWPGDQWHFSDWPRPWVIDVDAWRFKWLPEVELPPGSNPSTRLFIHFYPLGVVSIGLATAVGFGDGIEITPLTLLLKQMMPAKAKGDDKAPWLQVVAPQTLAGRELNLDGLADIVLNEMRASLFKSPESAQLVRTPSEPGEAHLRGHHGAIIELVRVEPQRFDKERHAAGLRGIVTMRPSWNDIELERLLKYRDAKTWTGRTSAWHYAGGANTVLWNASLPQGQRRRLRRGYTWRVAAVSELARLEKVLYEYGRFFVAPRAHAQLDQWRPLWRKLGGLPRVLSTNDMQLTYDSHAQALEIEQAREALRRALANRGDVEAMEQEHLIRLRQILVERFSEPELRTLCFDLGTEYDDLGGRGRADNARELIAHLHRRRRIRELVERVRAQRPDVDLEGFDE